MNENEKEMAEFARRLIETAGAILRSERQHTQIVIMEKTSHMDIVTQQDGWIEDYISSAILEKYPEHAVLAEECHHAGASDNSDYTWVIDPIDGTINFCRFARDYAISLALYYGKRPVFGLVYDVADDRMYSAGTGSIPAMNGILLQNPTCGVCTLRQAVIGMSFRTMKELGRMGTDVMGLLSEAHAHRYLGCASLELCRVASGEYDLFISSNVHTWDIAAARILIEQLGGFLTVCEKGREVSYAGKLFVAAYRSPELWKEVFQLLPQRVQNAFGY